MALRLRVGRVLSLFLLPAGLVCVGFPFYALTLPGGWDIVDDTRAAFGAGAEAGGLKAAAVDCVRGRTGSNSTRGIGLTGYACVIDLSEAQDGPADDPFAGRSREEGMAEYDRRLAAQMKALLERSLARQSNRIERRLATDRSGDLPAVRILSADGEPRRVGLVWGFGELAWRWASWLVANLLVLLFGAAALFAAKVAWKRRPAPDRTLR
ncbi:MAG TPA: hypothetical protein VD846_00325 [Allosphingosinicella sp.]|nr:hypothetical protein [Allosphingosinicella sp.]